MASVLSGKNILAAVWILTLILVLVTPALTGLVGLIVAMLIVLVTGIILTFRHGPKIWIGNRFSQMLVAASTLIVICFVATARQPSDLLFLGNFLGILVGPPMLFLSRRFSGLDWTKRIILMAACGAILAGLIAVYEVTIVGDLRAHGFYLGGANEFGQFALLFAAICLGGLMVWHQIAVRLFLTAAVAASTVAIVLTGSRGVAVAVVPMALASIIFAVQGSWRSRRIFAVVAMVGVVAAGSIWAASMNSIASNRILETIGQVQQVLETGYSDEVNIQIRLDLYRSGWDSFVSSPLVGVGWVQSLEAGNAAVQADPHLPDWVKQHHYPLLHNDIIGFAASMGLLGLVAFVLLVAAPWLGVGVPDELRRFRLYLLFSIVCIFHIFALNDVSLTVGAGVMAYIVISALIVGTFTTAPPDKVQTPT